MGKVESQLLMLVGAHFVGGQLMAAMTDNLIVLLDKQVPILGAA